LQPLCIGSIEEIVVDPWLNKLPWNLSGGSATLYVVDPNGVLTSYAMTIVPNGFGAFYNYTVIGPANVSTSGDPLLPPWRLAFLLVDAQGRTQKSLPVAFSVISSPV
jgi:hypothetical protein